MIKIIGSLLFSVMFSSCMADSLPIRQRAAQQTAQVDKKKTAYVSVDLVVEKQEAVVGEAIPYTIRVVFDPQTTEISQVVPPTIAHAKVDALIGPVKRQRTIKNRHCMVYEWNGTCYPEWAGALEISPAQVEYINRSETNRRGGFMVGFFGAFDRSLNTIFSEAANIEVAPLDRLVQKSGGLVGDFSDIYVSVSTNEIAQGDAAVLRLEIVGKGNLSKVAHPLLHLPKGLKWYASESRLTPEGKLFEYVVQAQEKGFFMIPVQKIYYFDTEQLKVQDLRSDPTHLSVTLNRAMQTTEDDLTRELSLVAEQAVEPESPEKAEHEQKGPSWLRRLMLPEWLFWLLLVSIIIAALIREYYASVMFIWVGVATWYRRRMFFIKIRRIINNSKKNGSNALLYEHFQKLQTRVDWNRIQHTSDKLSSEWEYCWGQLLQNHFGKEDSLSEDFLQRAQRLLNELEKGRWFL